MPSYITLGSILGGTTFALLLIRRYMSRKWGSFSSNIKLDGKVVIVTGGNTGLGAEVAKDIAARGATLILACRNWERTKDFLGELRRKSGNNDVHFMKLDLASLHSVAEFCQEFTDKYNRLDILICNAGVWIPMDKNLKTEDGFEIHVGTNHLGHFYLTHRLKQVLEATANSRTVVVSSSLMRTGRFAPADFDNFHEGRIPEKKAGFAPTGYCDSKLMNALFTRKLAEVMPNMMSVCVCPGFCATELGRHVRIPWYKKMFFPLVALLFMRSAYRGAQNITFGALKETSELTNGGFYRECKLSPDDMSRLDKFDKDELWSLSANYTNISQ
eukprot:TRINITY_DN5307_c0_g2_i1.p1 TRINITY_DN5307_c0_g2~~TRINITY_DN5307_c0_g2_i1.p1  ORF type:complete len:329 (+),score=42.68 TRINITY_DN5307_c0_g2_i1:75-1061(+)